MEWTFKSVAKDVLIDCGLQPYCEFCFRFGFKVWMKLFLIKFLNFDVNNPGGDNRDAYALDMEMRCPACGFHETFGVALTKEQFYKTYNAIKEPE